MPQAIARRWVDPQIVQAIGVFLAWVGRDELKATANRGGDMAEKLRAYMAGFGPMSWLGSAGIRLALGGERVDEFAGYGQADFDAVRLAVMDSYPAFAATLTANAPWFLREIGRLRDVIVSG